MKSKAPFLAVEYTSDIRLDVDSHPFHQQHRVHIRDLAILIKPLSITMLEEKPARDIIGPELMFSVTY